VSGDVNALKVAFVEELLGGVGQNADRGVAGYARTAAVTERSGHQHIEAVGQ
jgi:hypothetical protein